MSTVKKIRKKKLPPKRITYSYTMDECELSIYEKDDEYSPVFSFRIDQLPFCCGVYEIGEIDDTRLDNTNVFKETLHEALIELMHEHEGHTVVCSTIKNAACSTLKSAFIKTGLFTLVKTFNNSNSGNEIEFWVSNNS